jgi:hypothetical protein
MKMLFGVLSLLSLRSPNIRGSAAFDDRSHKAARTTNHLICVKKEDEIPECYSHHGID